MPACRSSGAAGGDGVHWWRTPSLFSGAAIDRLLASLRARLPLLADAEVTMEANPGTFERSRLPIPGSPG